MNQNIKDWQVFLSSKGLYQGPKDGIPNDQLKNAVKIAENKLSKDVPTIKNIIIKNNEIQNILVHDYVQAEKIIENKKAELFVKQQINKYAQGAPEGILPIEPVPLAVKWAPTQEDTLINTGDPTESQQQGLLANETPKKALDSDTPKPQQTEMNIDDRMLAIIDLIDIL